MFAKVWEWFKDLLKTEEEKLQSAYKKAERELWTIENHLMILDDNIQFLEKKLKQDFVAEYYAVIKETNALKKKIEARIISQHDILRDLLHKIHIG